MITYEVVIENGIVEEHVVIHARSADEAMDQAILIIGETYRTVDSATVTERA